MEDYNQQRIDGVSSWHKTFMEIAHVIARRSKDPSTQVGAVIVAEDNRILSLGYNGATVGFDDRQFPWELRHPSMLNKYHLVVHGERNAVLNFRGNLRELQGASVYVTRFPCNECAKELAQVGIKTVYYAQEAPTRTIAEQLSLQAAMIIFDNAGIDLVYLKGEEQ